jgi:PKD repeat protein
MRFLRSGVCASVALWSALALLPNCASPAEPQVESGTASDAPAADDKSAGSGSDISTEAIVAFQQSAAFRDEGRRCGTPDLPVEMRRRLGGQQLVDNADCTQTETRVKPDYAPGDILEIPVIVHVIAKKSGVGRIPENYIRSQIDVLNEDYSALDGTLGAGGTNVRVRFRLVDKDPQGRPHPGFEYVVNDAFFNDPGPSAENPMKQALHWDTKRYLNLYTNDASGGGTLGYATFPQDQNGTGGYLDGVVIVHTSFGRDAPSGGQYDKGRTATHEVGHYLGLFHTFQNGCSDAANPYRTGDLIRDTSPASGPTFDCPVGARSCSGLAPIRNYMDYTQDTCMNEFSPEQSNRIRCAIVNYRKNLYRVIGATPGPNQNPVADFGVTRTGLTVAFIDRSTDADGRVASRLWSFGDGTTSTAKDPAHTYAARGTFSVSLTVTDDGGATGTRTASVDVSGADSDAGAPSDGTLASGVAVTGLSGAQNTELRFKLVTTAGSTKGLVVDTFGGTGDADLYVRFGAPPTATNYDFRPFKATSDERVSIARPRAGTYYVMVRGGKPFKGVSLRATY